jgi:hypothetical protein
MPTATVDHQDHATLQLPRTDAVLSGASGATSFTLVNGGISASDEHGTVSPSDRERMEVRPPDILWLHHTNLTLIAGGFKETARSSELR